MKKKTSTGELYELLETSGDFCAVDKILETEPITFTRYLKELMKTYQISGTGLMRNSLLSKSYTYQVLDGSRQPERNVVLRLAFSLGCSLKEVQHLLALSDNGILYPKIRRDAAIVFGIRQGYSLAEENEFLEKIGEQGLL